MSLPPSPPSSIINLRASLCDFQGIIPLNAKEYLPANELPRIPEPEMLDARDLMSQEGQERERNFFKAVKIAEEARALDYRLEHPWQDFLSNKIFDKWKGLARQKERQVQRLVMN